MLLRARVGRPAQLPRPVGENRVRFSPLFLYVMIPLTSCPSTGSIEKKDSLGREISPGEMPDGTHRKSIAEGMPQGHHFGRKNTASNGEKSGGFRDRLKDKFRSKK